MSAVYTLLQACDQNIYKNKFMSWYNDWCHNSNTFKVGKIFFQNLKTSLYSSSSSVFNKTCNSITAGIMI